MKKNKMSIIFLLIILCLIQFSKPLFSQVYLSMENILSSAQEKIISFSDFEEKYNKPDSARFFNFNTLQYAPIINSNEQINYRIFYDSNNRLNELICYNIPGIKELNIKFYHTFEFIFYTGTFIKVGRNRLIPILGFFVYSKEHKRTILIHVDESCSFNNLDRFFLNKKGPNKESSPISLLIKEFNGKMVKNIYILDYQLKPMSKIKLRENKLLYTSKFTYNNLCSEIIKIYPQKCCGQNFDLWQNPFFEIIDIAERGLDVHLYPIEVIAFPKVKKGIHDIWLYPVYQYRKEICSEATETEY